MLSSAKLIGAQQRESLTLLPPFIISSCWRFAADQVGDNAEGTESSEEQQEEWSLDGHEPRDRGRSLENTHPDILENGHPSR